MGAEASEEAGGATYRSRRRGQNGGAGPRLSVGSPFCDLGRARGAGHGARAREEGVREARGSSRNPAFPALSPAPPPAAAYPLLNFGPGRDLSEVL